MKSLWDDKAAKDFFNNALDLRVYTSRLLGQNPDLVLHGGGNTSVKAELKDDFGQTQSILYVKASGWDLATIKPEGFAGVKMDALLKMAEFEHLSDTDMVRMQRCAMIDPYAPNPSVEAILHAIIPFKFVDHTHADVVVTVTNTPNGEKKIREIYGERVIIIPYVMPGFILARKVFELTRDIDWKNYDCMVLLNHGIFTFDDDAKVSYEKMIRSVTKVEEYLKKNNAVVSFEDVPVDISYEDLKNLAVIRKKVSLQRGCPVLSQIKLDGLSANYAKNKNLKKVALQGPLTPDHVIRTKRIPIILDKNVESDLEAYGKEYDQYFKKYKEEGVICLDCAPRWGIWRDRGRLSFGRSVGEMNIINDITKQTMNAILNAELLGGWRALDPKDIFDVEYWDLEQAKLKKQANNKVFQGKVFVVTGAASGIGKACTLEIVKQGGCVTALDISSDVESLFDDNSVLGLRCDLTDEYQIEEAIKKTILQFGGIDGLVSNAGVFPMSATIENMDESVWQLSMDVNLTSHQRLLKRCIPFLEQGVDPAVVFIGSKNVPAPGPGAGAYSVAKAGLTQLARVAALELAEKGIRVNTLHPNQVFDTAIWTDEVLKKRAEHYGVSVDEYKKSNLLKTELVSSDVASLACALLSPLFSKTTGAQIPVDGGNDRVI